MPEKQAYLQFRTHFSIRQEIYCRLSIVRCWQIPHIFHIRPPETWGRFKTQGTSSTKTVFDLRSTSRNEANILSILHKNIFSGINAISAFINHLGIHLEIIWKMHLFGWCSSINAAPCSGKFYLYIHAFNRFSYSCIHSFTRPSQWLCVISACVWVCVTCGVALLCCRLVQFPRGLSSFTEPWQKMEAGRGVRCIKKPLPSSDLSPLPHTHAHTPACQAHAISPVLAAAGVYTLSNTQTYGCAHTFTHHQTQTRSIIRWLPQKESGRHTTVVILHFNGSPRLPPSFPFSLSSGESWAGGLQATSHTATTTGTEQHNHNLAFTAMSPAYELAVTHGWGRRLGVRCTCALWEEVHCLWGRHCQPQRCTYRTGYGLLIVLEYTCANRKKRFYSSQSMQTKTKVSSDFKMHLASHSGTKAVNSAQEEHSTCPWDGP